MWGWRDSEIWKELLSGEVEGEGLEGIAPNACYGKGGPATVTDANLVLGRLSPRGLLGGGMALDAAAARAALAPDMLHWRLTVLTPDGARTLSHRITILAILVSINYFIVEALLALPVERGLGPEAAALVVRTAPL